MKNSGESKSSASIVDMIVKSTATRPVPAASGFQLFLASGRPSRPRSVGLRDGRGDVAGFSAEYSQVYNTLPDREAFQLQARKVNAERHATKKTSPPDRSR